MSSSLSDLLQQAEKAGASDLHIVANAPPMIRVNGQLIPLSGQETMSARKAERACFEVLSEDMKKDLKSQGELSLSYAHKDKARFRVNVYFEGGTVGGHFRRIPSRVPEVEELGLPKNVMEFSNFGDGLVLVSGPMRSGRTTTVSSLLRRINDTRSASILTVESPVEFQFKRNKSLVRHREIGRDVVSVDAAVGNLFKQDVDVCFLGDIYRPEDYIGLTNAGASGALVFGVTFASSAVEAIDNYFANVGEGERSWVARVLANNLKAVINQRLLPGTSGQQVLAVEILLPTPEIRECLRNQDLNPINELIRKDQNKTGMTTINQSLMGSLIKRKVELRTAFSASPDPEELDQMLKRAGI